VLWTFTVHNSARPGLWPTGAQLSDKDPCMQLIQAHLSQGSQQPMSFSLEARAQQQQQQQRLGAAAAALLEPLQVTWEELALRAYAAQQQLHQLLAAIAQVLQHRWQQLSVVAQQAADSGAGGVAATWQQLSLAAQQAAGSGGGGAAEGKQQLLDQLGLLGLTAAPGAPEQEASALAAAPLAHITSSRGAGSPQQFVLSTWQSVQRHPLYSAAQRAPGWPFSVLGLAAVALLALLGLVKGRQRAHEQQLYLQELQMGQESQSYAASQRARWQRAIGTDSSDGGGASSAASSSMYEDPEEQEQQVLAAAAAAAGRSQRRRGWLAGLFGGPEDEASQWARFMEQSGAMDVREVWRPEMADALAPKVGGAERSRRVAGQGRGWRLLRLPCRPAASPPRRCRRSCVCARAPGDQGAGV
jgi:hypothetical protein